MNNINLFVGDLTKIDVSTYTNKDQITHNRVDFVLASRERIGESIKLKVAGFMGDQLAALLPQPGLCSVVAYLEFYTFDYQGKTCQEIRVSKLEVTLPAIGQVYVIAKQQPSNK